jgi:hypothetical protein
MNMVNKSMAGIVKTLERTLNSQNLEKVSFGDMHFPLLVSELSYRAPGLVPLEPP